MVYIMRRPCHPPFAPPWLLSSKKKLAVVPPSTMEFKNVLAGWLVGWLAGWLVGWFTAWLLGWLAAWLLGCFY